MYARLVRFTVADRDKATPENAQQMIRERVIPMLSQYDGYAGYLSFMDKERNRARAIILWDTEEHAEAAEQTLGERRLEMAAGVGLTLESTELLEAIAVELTAAAHV